MIISIIKITRIKRMAIIVRTKCEYVKELTTHSIAKWVLALLLNDITITSLIVANTGYSDGLFTLSLLMSSL